MDNTFTIGGNKVDSHPTIDDQGDLQVKFNIYFPNITASKRYRHLVRAIHHEGWFISEILCKVFPWIHHTDHPANY